MELMGIDTKKESLRMSLKGFFVGVGDAEREGLEDGIENEFTVLTKEERVNIVDDIIYGRKKIRDTLLMSRADSILEKTFDMGMDEKSRIRRSLILEKVEKVRAELDLVNVVAKIYKGDYSRDDLQLYREIGDKLYLPVVPEYFYGLFNARRDKILDASITDLKFELYRKQLLEIGIFRNNKVGLAIMDNEVVDGLRAEIGCRYASFFEILESVTCGSAQNEKYSAKETAAIFERVLDSMGYDDWIVEMTSQEKVMAIVMSKNTLLIPSRRLYEKSAIRRLLVHEIGAHICRVENGRKSGDNILAIGTANYYSRAEEGLASLLEVSCCGEITGSGGTGFDRIAERYITAGLLDGVDGEPRTAEETYNILWRMFLLDGSVGGDLVAAKNRAYAHIDKAFRGATFDAPGVYYPLLRIYYGSLVKNLEYFKRNKDNLALALDVALMGRYDHTSKDERDAVLTLLGREGLIDRIA